MAEWKKIVLAEVLVEKGYIRGPYVDKDIMPS